MAALPPAATKVATCNPFVSEGSSLFLMFSDQMSGVDDSSSLQV